METFTDLFFPSTLDDQLLGHPSDAAFPKSAWVPKKISDVQHALGVNSGDFGFAQEFYSGMIMPAAAEGAPYDPIVRGHGPPGRVVSLIQ